MHNLTGAVDHLRDLADVEKYDAEAAADEARVHRAAGRTVAALMAWGAAAHAWRRVELQAHQAMGWTTDDADHRTWHELYILAIQEQAATTYQAALTYTEAAGE